MKIKPVKNYGENIKTSHDLVEMRNGEVIFYVGNDPAIVRKQIMDLKDKMLALEHGQEEMPVEHFLMNGFYTRKLFIKKGTLLVGKIHKKACINIVASGDISVMTESGSKRVQAGYVQETPAWIQKVGYAHEDTVFINVFQTDETDIEKIEAEIACESYDEKEKLCL